MNDEATMQRLHWRCLAALLFCALVARLAWGLKFGANTPFGDEAEYMADARTILAGGTLAHQNWMLFIRAPGYAHFLAAVWTLAGGESRASVHVAQAVLSTASCGFIFALSRHIGARPVAALAATAIACFHPYLIYMVAALGTESVFAFFVTGGAYFLISGLDAEQGRRWRLSLSGLLLGLGNLIRPNLQTILPLVAVWFLFRYRKRLREAIVAFALIVSPVIALALPWSLAVERAGYGFVWVTDGGGVWYYMGHNDKAYELFCADQPRERREKLIRVGAPELTQWPGYLRAAAAPVRRRASEFWRVALEWDRSHLSAQPCLAVQKFYSFWRPWVNRDAYPFKIFLVSLVSAPTLVLGLWGTWLAWKRGERTATIFTWLVAGTGTLIAVVFSTEIRYRIPMVDVLLLSFAGVSIDRVFGWMRGIRADVG